MRPGPPQSTRAKATSKTLPRGRMGLSFWGRSQPLSRTRHRRWEESEAHALTALRILEPKIPSTGRNNCQPIPTEAGSPGAGLECLTGPGRARRGHAGQVGSAGQRCQDTASEGPIPHRPPARAPLPQWPRVTLATASDASGSRGIPKTRSGASMCKDPNSPDCSLGQSPGPIHPHRGPLTHLLGRGAGGRGSRGWRPDPGKIGRVVCP